MNNRIISLERRKNRVLKMRNCYLVTCDKEDIFEHKLKRYDSLIDKIMKAIRVEWNKIYRRN